MGASKRKAGISSAINMLTHFCKLKVLGSVCEVGVRGKTCIFGYWFSIRRSHLGRLEDPEVRTSSRQTLEHQDPAFPTS